MIGVVFGLCAAFVFYVYAAYPIAVVVLSRLRRAETYPDSTLPRVTMIIAAHDEAAVIGAKIAATLELDYPNLEVIVAADGSSDATADIAAGFGDRGVLVAHLPERRGKSAAISRAAAFATGEVLVFSDANNRFAPDALRRLVAPFADPVVAVVTGRKMTLGDDGLGYSESAYWRYESAIRTAESRIGTCIGVNGEIIAVRRNDFAPIPEDIVNDDAWLAHTAIAAGRGVRFAPDAISSEPVSISTSAEMRRRSRMVAGQWQTLSRMRGAVPWRRPVVAWMVVSHKVLRPVVPFAMIGALSAALLALPFPGAGLAGGWRNAALAAQAAFYLVALISPLIPGRVGRIAYVARYLVEANVAALWGLGRHLRGGQPVTWERVDRQEEAAA